MKTKLTRLQDELSTFKQISGQPFAQILSQVTKKYNMRISMFESRVYELESELRDTSESLARLKHERQTNDREAEIMQENTDLKKILKT